MKPASYTSRTGFTTGTLNDWLEDNQLPNVYDEKTNSLISDLDEGVDTVETRYLEAFRHEEYGGWGIRATRKLDAREGDLELCRIPRGMALNTKNIMEMHDHSANEPRRWEELNELVNDRQNSRMELMLILLLEMAKSSGKYTSPKSPSTVYQRGYMAVAFPEHVPLPTTWNEDEIRLLDGTSLHAAVAAKFNSLHREFQTLKERTQDLSWAQEMFWKDENLKVEDWFLIDSWYRSRCMEMPIGGTTMVPFLDLLNHSSKPNCHYVMNEDEEIELKLNPGSVVETGQELFINYGPEKSAGEMLFNYGFVEKSTLFEFLIGHIEQSVMMPAVMPDQDHKLTCYGRRFGTPKMKISGKKDKLKLESAFVMFLMLEEKDGMEIKTIKDEDGDEDYLAMWQGIDVTDRLDKLELILKRHPRKDLFDIRSMFIYHTLINHQMGLMQAAEDFEAEFEDDKLSEDEVQIHKAASELRAIESTILDSAMDLVQEWIGVPW